MKKTSVLTRVFLCSVAFGIISSCSKNTNSLSSSSEAAPAPLDESSPLPLITLDNVLGEKYILSSFDDEKEIYKINLALDGLGILKTEQGEKVVRWTDNNNVLSMTLLDKLVVENIRKFKNDTAQGKFLVTCSIEKIEIKSSITQEVTTEQRNCTVDPNAAVPPFKETVSSFKSKYKSQLIKEAKSLGKGTLLLNTGEAAVSWALSNNTLTLNISNPVANTATYRPYKVADGSEPYLLTTCKINKIEIKQENQNTITKYQICEVEPYLDQTTGKQIEPFTEEFSGANPQVLNQFKAIDGVVPGSSLYLSLPESHDPTPSSSLVIKIMDEKSGVNSDGKTVSYQLLNAQSELEVTLEEGRILKYRLVGLKDQRLLFAVSEIKNNKEQSLSVVDGLISEDDSNLTFEQMAGVYTSIYDGQSNGDRYDFNVNGLVTMTYADSPTRVYSWKMENGVAVLKQYKDENKKIIDDADKVQACAAESAQCSVGLVRTFKLVHSKDDVLVMLRTFTYSDDDHLSNLYSYKKVN